MLRTRILAAATATLLALGMAAGGASPAIANHGGPTPATPVSQPGIDLTDDNGLTCDGAGYSKPGAMDASSGTYSDAWGSVSWDGSTFSWTLTDGYDVDFCVKGSTWVADVDTSAHPDDSYDFAAQTGHGISHVGFVVRSIATPLVEGSTTSTPENCLDGAGTITFAGDEGVTFTVAGVEGTFEPGDVLTGLSAGDYEVTTIAPEGSAIDGDAVFTETVESTSIDCELPLVEASTTSTPENCLDGAGTITFAGDEGVTFTVAGVEGTFEPGDILTGLSAGDYEVTAIAPEGSAIDGDAVFTETVESTSVDCDEPEVVVPAFTVVDETCVSGILLQGGSIVLDTKGGTISYVVTDADDNVVEDLTDLAPGAYTVTPSPVGDVELGLEGYSDQAVVDAFDGECGSVLPITDAFLAFIDPTCDDREQLDPDNFEYDPELAELTIVEVEENGDFLVVFTALGEDTRFFQEIEGDFETADHSGVTRTVEEDGTVLVFEGTLAGPNTELCEDEVVVVPPVTVVDNCFEQSYTITEVEGVTYAVSVNGSLPMGISFEEGEDTATFGADPFDEIVVIASADEGYLLAEGYEPFEYTYAFDEDCLPTAPVTTASVTWTQADCLGNPGSYTLTNEPGVIWTVDGVVVAGNTKYTAAIGSTPTIVASLAPASEEFPTGFGWSDEDQRTLWNLVFAAAEDCLPTLALTGASNALGGLGVIAILIMMAGTGLVVARRREAVRIQG